MSETTTARAAGGFQFRACQACGDVGRLRVFVDSDGLHWHVKRDNPDGTLALCGKLVYYPVRRRTAVPTGQGER